VQLATPARIGKVVLTWEAAYGVAYAIQASADGQTWTTLKTVDDGDGGTDALRTDSATPVRFVRMQGIRRFNPQWGFSLWEMALYPVRT
jgi:hyaluronoglucosaminidase